MMSNCTGCHALLFPLSGGVCIAGIRTGTTVQNGRRIRHPMTTCSKPRTSGELANRIELLEIERREENERMD